MKSVNYSLSRNLHLAFIILLSTKICCELCQLWFVKRSEFDTHNSFMHEINMIIKSESTINENSYQVISDLPVIRNTNVQIVRLAILERTVKQFKCSEFHSSFKGKSVMKRHIDWNHSKKPFKCSKYDSTFKLKKKV